MAKLDSEDLLAAWQVLWGQLDSKWHPLFLNDPIVNEILWYDSEFIYPSLKKFQKLSEVLRDIQQRTVIEPVSVDLEAREEFLNYISERDHILESGKKRKAPIPLKPDPKAIEPLEKPETTIEEMRHQLDKRHWW
jgi:hypothetical protein